MGPISPINSVQRFIAAIRNRTDPHTEAMLHQSLNAWLSYYRCLQILLETYRPSVTAFMREHFYPFAHAVLDHVAETFCYFFALPCQPSEFTHTRLTQMFLNICAEKRLQGEVAELHALMRELYTRIIVQDAHSETRGMLGSTYSRAITPPEDLIALLACIDQYIVALLGFLEQNIEQSLYRSDAHTEPLSLPPNQADTAS